jgi:ATP-dependent Clp protease ATP-binding subunit ClpA
MLDRGAMFERFTERARHAVVLAQEEARRLQHNYIGTEHILLGLLSESGGIACRALDRFGISLDGTRDEVRSIIGLGKAAPSGHIPFTPRAKKTLELALREALQLHQNFIGTEHILLGIIREGDGVGAQIMKQHSSDLTEIRAAVLEMMSMTSTESSRGRRWLRRRSAIDTASGGGGSFGGATEPGDTTEMRTTPAADVSLSAAARLAGSQPVGSHHLLLAAIADADSAAARALVALGVDLNQARDALRNADVTGTSDEQPEEAGRRQMLIKVTDDKLTIEAADPVIVRLGQAALSAQEDQGGIIRGDLPVNSSLAAVWQSLHDSLAAIERRANLPADSPDSPDRPGSEAG